VRGQLSFALGIPSQSNSVPPKRISWACSIVSSPLGSTEGGVGEIVGLGVMPNRLDSPEACGIESNTRKTSALNASGMRKRGRSVEVTRCIATNC